MQTAHTVIAAALVNTATLRGRPARFGDLSGRRDGFAVRCGQFVARYATRAEADAAAETAVDAYAERHRVEPATVVRRATGNPRLYDRLKKRVAKMEEDIERIARFMADNSSVDALPDGSPVLNNEDDTGLTVSQGGEIRTGGEA